MLRSLTNRTRVTSEILLGVFMLAFGCTIYLLFRSKSLNIYQWCSALGVTNTIGILREHVQNWEISEFVKFSLPDGLYCTAYILIIDGIWHNDRGWSKDIIILFIPFVSICSEVLQYMGLVNGTFDIYDLTCYSIPILIYYVLKKFKQHHSLIYLKNNHGKKHFSTMCVTALLSFCLTSSCKKGNNIDLSSEQFAGKSEKVKEITSIEEMRKITNNTIWTHSKEDYLWYKLFFKDNLVEQYTAILSNSKKWEYLGSSTYTFKRGKFPDGTEYISAEFLTTKDNMAAEFIFTNCHLYISGIDIGVFENIDIEW